MLIEHFKKDEEKGVLKYTVQRTWNHEGHEVALVMLENVKTDYECKNLCLMCECDIAEDRSIDCHKCPHKFAVRLLVRLEAWQKYGAQWVGMNIKDAVMDVFERHQKGEYLGSFWPEMIYVQDVAEILHKSVAEVHQACDQLFAGEKLDLNGMILIPFTPMFRFPKELESVMRYMIEEPLGWPNGEAGDCFVGGLEVAITEHTDHKSGKEAFWEHNYPHVAPHLLLMFGAHWLELAVARAESDPEALKDLEYMRLGHLAKELRQLARRLYKLKK